MENEIRSPAKAIRAFCLECCGGNSNEVRNCTSERCPLKPFRFGKNPFTKRELTDEQREQLAERLAKARAARQEADDE